MKITFLGTGTSQGVPVIACSCDVCSSNDEKDKRLRSSILIETNTNTFVIDTTPDFRQQMLRENITNLDAIIVTHGHKDHIGGLDDIRAYNFTQKKPMDVYARKNVCELIKNDFSYVFSKLKYPGIPKITLHEVENKKFFINNLEITPINTSHHHLSVFGYRIGDFTYITDTNKIASEEIEKVRGSKILVLNALRKEKHISHFNLEEAVSLIQEIKPNKAYLTHTSHLMGLYCDIEKELPKNIHLAYDGLSVVV